MNRSRVSFLRRRLRWAAACIVLLFALTPILPIAPAFGQIAQTGEPEQPDLADLATVSPSLLAEIADGNVPASFLVVLDAQIDPQDFTRVPAPAAEGYDHSARTSHIARLYAALTQIALRSQAPVRAWLDAQELAYRPFYIVNMIEVRLAASPESGLPVGDVIDALRRIPAVDRIVANPQVNARHDLGVAGSEKQEAGSVWPRFLEQAGNEPENEPEAVASQYGLDVTGARTVWAEGFRGQGIVIADQDTGIQWDHPALVAAYRGWDAESASASHPYNWFDAWADAGDEDFCTGDPQIPCDDHGHGTHTAGTLVGDAGGAIGALGMAPDAEWMGCRNMLDGIGKPSTYAACFEFFLAPYPQNGDPFTDGRPDLAPHIISNSWGCPPSEGCDVDSLRQVVQMARAAGQFVVSSAGNAGASCRSVVDPIAIYDAAFTVGAHDASGQLAGFSSRGPVAIDGSNRLKPDITAPGVGILSSFPTYRPSGPYTYLQGTSMAAPHVAGAAALLWSAVPALIGNIDLTEQLLIKSAAPVPDTRCGSGAATVPNNAYGYGRLAIAAAVAMALHPASLTVRAIDGARMPEADVPVRIVDRLTGYTYSGETGADGSLTLDALYAGQYIVWIENTSTVCGPSAVTLEADGELEVDQAEQFCLLLPFIYVR